jgi:hypothetical protein
MIVWHNLSDGNSWNKVTTFLSTSMTGVPPVSWRTLLPSVPLKPVPILIANVTAVRRPDSGALELQFQKDISPADALTMAIFAEDPERQTSARVEPLPSGVLLILETSLPSQPVPSEEPPDLLSIGPGGNAIAFYTGDAILADVTVRTRLDSIPGNWRQSADIMARLRCECPGGTPAGLDMQGAFGYFELTKYERQTLIRPVFLFSVTQPQAADGQWPGWQITIVEPATTSTEVPLDEGLGSWAE